MWEKEKGVMREYYLTNNGANKTTASPTKKNKLAASKLLTISDDVKAELLKKWLAKCKTEFNVCFIEFRLDLNPCNFQPVIYKYIEELKRQIKAYEKEIFSGVKQTDTLYDWVSSNGMLMAERERTLGDNADLVTDHSPPREAT
jgi:hypothetical protein